MAPRPTFTIRRADVPGWVFSCCGVVYLDERRVALLIGGRPRTIALRPGERTIRVRLRDQRRPIDVIRTVSVEEGQAYRYRCGAEVEKRGQTYVILFLVSLVYFVAGMAGFLLLPLLRSPASALLGSVYQDTSVISDRLFPFLNRLVRGMTSETLGMILGVIVAATMTRAVRAAMNRRFSYYLDEE